MRRAHYAWLAGIGTIASLISLLTGNLHLFPPMFSVSILVATFGILTYYVDARIRRQLAEFIDGLEEPASRCGGEVLFEVRLLQRMLYQGYPLKEAARELEHVVKILEDGGYLDDDN